MKNAKLAKLLVKGVTSVVFSAAIGYAVKLNKKIDAAIDEHYTIDPESDQDN